MLKKLYLKYFIFFLSLLAYNFYSYGRGLSKLSRDDDYSPWQQLLNGNNLYNQDYAYRDVKAETPFLKAVTFGIKQGAAKASTNEAVRVISRLLEIIPFTVNKGIAMTKIYWYKIAFGTTGLSVRDLTKFSNRINTLFQPIVNQQTANLRKTKRAAVIEGEQTTGEIVDTIWLERRELLISELEHVISFFKNVLPCYSAAFQSIDTSFFERQMANVLYAISTENNNEIQHYIILLIGYINDLIKLLKSLNSFDNAVERADETKMRLTLARTTFEHIATFLADSTAKGSGSFQKMSDDAGSNKRDIMDLLGNGR